MKIEDWMMGPAYNLKKKIASGELHIEKMVFD
jgi:hypothetical protein